MQQNNIYMMKIYLQEKIESIPFVEIVGQYAENLFNYDQITISPLLEQNLQSKLLEELSSYSEVTLQIELDKFVNAKNNHFDIFIKETKSSLAKDYPVLHEKLKTKAHNFASYIFKIAYRFQEDLHSIIKTFDLDTTPQDLKIIDLDVSLGDAHNGEGTALVYLSNGTKLIYKPRNVEISSSYNLFITWINKKLNLDLKSFKILPCEAYGWLEFVEYTEVAYEEDLQEYYYKAGALLAIALLLGSKDYHRENIIASGKNPILIDHETIIQPFLSNKSINFWDSIHEIPPFSVLESALIYNSETDIPKDLVGFGINGYVEIIQADKVVIKPNTLDSKRVIRYKTRNITDKNVPKYLNKYVFANQYKNSFKNGFSTLYELFSVSKMELKSDTSPLSSLRNKEVRYVWRPTFVYFNILQYLRNPSFMVNSEAYKSKLFELLSKAYKGEHMDEYRFILEFEMKQMLNGDIPIFNLQSTDNFLEGNTSFKIFQKNCLENIYHRIDILSEEHKKEQIRYIDNWLNI